MSSGRKKVVVAMSGGVDSSVAAGLLCEQGYEVTGLFMNTGIKPSDEQGTDSRPRGCCGTDDASDARSVAGMLGIPFFSLDFKEHFDWIIDYFVDEYHRGRTPNPCVLCNELLKFGRLADYGKAAGADFVATGHYARIEVTDSVYRLLRGVDSDKDQSYVLFGLTRAQLPRILFPLGGMTKDKVREHARRLGLPLSEKPESQDICFVPDRDYARLVRQRCPQAFVEGPIIDTEGNEIGRHRGLANFTIGQRRGLNVAMGVPVYVTRLDIESNTVVVGTKEQLASDKLSASRVHWIVDCPSTPIRAGVKIRYGHQAAPAVVEPLSDNRARVQFDRPQDAITPGQAAVFYDGDVVLGGGWID